MSEVHPVLRERDYEMVMARRLRLPPLPPPRKDAPPVKEKKRQGRYKY